MAARLAAVSRTRARGCDRGLGPPEAAWDGVPRKACGEDYHSSSLPDLAIAGLDTGEILGAFHGYADQTIISIIEDSSPAENKSPLDEESEATLLTALTEILDTVDDENLSPFDTLPDTELFASPKDVHAGLLGVGRHLWASFPDSAKDHFEGVDAAVPQGVSWSSDNPTDRSFGAENLPDPIGDTVSGVGDVSKPATEILELQLDEQLGPAGLEDSVTLVLGQNLPCVINVEHVSLCDLVKYIHPYCLPSGPDTNSATDAVELDVEIVQEGKLLDLGGPALLCEGHQRPSEVRQQAAGQEPTTAAIPAPDGLPGTRETDAAPDGLPGTREMDAAPDGLPGTRETDAAPDGLPGIRETDAAPDGLPGTRETDAAPDGLPGTRETDAAPDGLPGTRETDAAPDGLPGTRETDAAPDGLPGTRETDAAPDGLPGTRETDAAPDGLPGTQTETAPDGLPGAQLGPDAVPVISPPQQENPAAPVRKRGRPRKTAKPEEPAAVRVQPERAQAPVTRSSLRKQLCEREGPAQQHVGAVGPDTRARLSRGRAAARGRGRQGVAVRRRAPSPQSQVCAEAGSSPAPTGAMNGAEGEAVCPRPGPRGVTGGQEGATASADSPDTPPASPPGPPPSAPRTAPAPGAAPPPSAPAPGAAPPPSAPAPGAASAHTTPGAAPAPSVAPAPGATLPCPPSSEPRLRPISLEQYRQRLQQRQRAVGSSAPQDAHPVLGPTPSAWPVVPLASIVQGELSVLPLDSLVCATDSALPARQGPRHRGRPLSHTHPTPNWALPHTHSLPPVPSTVSAQPPTSALPSTQAPAPAWAQVPPAPASLAQTPGRAQTFPAQAPPARPPGRAQAPSLEPAVGLMRPIPVEGPAHHPEVVCAQTPSRSPPNPAPLPRASTALGPAVPAPAAAMEGSVNTQSNMSLDEPAHRGCVPVGPPQVWPQPTAAQQQCSRMGCAEEEGRQSRTSPTVQDSAKGIEATDLMSLLEQFEVTEVKDEPSPGGSSGTELPEGRRFLDQVFGAELASTAGLTPPATPPHQHWKSLSPACRQHLVGAEPCPISPQRTARFTEARPLVQNKRTKCVGAPSPQPVPTPPPAFGDHEYCLPSVPTSQTLPHRMIPLPTARPHVACRWNVKRQPSITIKPITLLNHRSAKTPCQVLAAEVQKQGGSPWDGQGLTGDVVLSGEDPRTCSQAPDRGHISCGSSDPEEGTRVTPSPCGSGEHGGKDPSDSPQHCARTRTSPCYRRQYSSASSSGSTSRSRSRSQSPAQKRRRYYRRRSRHSRHSSRSDSRSSSRSRSYSRSNSRSTSRSRSRSRSPQRCSVRMSYFTDEFDPYDVGPRHRYRYSRREAHEHKISRRRELAIEERRVVYVGKIRNGMMREELRRRFEVFGEIEDCNIYFRTQGDNYGFVTYRYTCDAFAAIENGQTLRRPDELPFDLCFGGRRQFCKTNYADLDSSHSDISSYSSKSKFDSLDFDTLLKQAKRSLRR
ncbi:peroxisome proliferator-activated receptor gamma coactivator-related protein 1-like [Pristis pectinata]|uniref:peroxisome proliferator-activated receptor gamma coactivator-related protein 1-like n=1 Tax=Pristis pectinata TaxID=685728 RepID=UPI00223D0CC8|nr:peroxisome proliferator-activated receptor gamma coactivator-related protein 1-like [Pristis pectinata]